MSASSSSSSLVLLAAHEQWLNSPRTIQDWTEFIDTIQHILATKQHQIPPTQMTMGNAGVELPQNGIHGESVSGGLQSMAARFESLLDQLYLTQGYRNSHHTRTIVEDAAGASLPTTSLTPLRFLSATCYRSLKDLFLQQDVALEAIFLQYRDVGGASNPSGYKDFLHSLITLSQRWKRYIFFRDDPVDYLRQSRALFGLLEDYLAQRLITYGEYDFLENQLYNLSIGGVDELGSNGGGGESEFLLAAWSVAWTDLQSGVDVTKVADEFYDSILHLLENQIQLIYHRYTAEAREFLVQLNSNLNYRFAPATLKHLMSLIDHQTMLEEMKRRGDRRPLTKAEEELSRQSTLFFACFAESAASQNVYELIESLQVIGNAWRKTSPHLALLQCIRYVEEHGLLTASEADRAELLVYLEDGFLLSAWSVYEDADYTKSAFDEFIESVRVALEHEYRASITAIVREGYRLVNAWSITPDPVPILYSDPIRNEVLGIQRVPPHESVDLLRPFELPRELRHQLSSRDSEHLRALLRERDPVVLALLQEFRDTSNLADLIDGLTRCIARVEFGAAANAPKKRQYQQVAGNGNSSNVDVSQRYEFGDQQLDIYQLSQMLLSLHQDGYLSRDTLTQLLYAAQERHDPVLLAAFSIYKESLESNGGDESDSGWAEMWSILQLTWQRIQRDQRHMADARASQSSGAIGFLAPHDAILLRHVGTVLLDSLSASAAISITNVLYLRDLLRNGDPALYAILSLAEDGNIADSDETYDSLIALSQRWVKELDPIGQQLYRLLNSLAEAKFFSDAALDYLLGLVYARDPTLHGAFAVYAESAPNGTDSEEDDRDSEFEDEEDDDDEDDDDDDYDEDDDSEDDSDDDDEDDWSTYGDESDARDEYKYDSSSAGARASPRHHRRNSRLKRTPALPRALAEFVDSLHHLLSSGDRAIGELIGSEDESPRGLKSPLAQSISTEAQWEAEAQQVEPARKAAPISYGLPYFEE